MDKFILLSFDIEEFDIPKEYGQLINDSEQFSVSLEGLENIVVLLDKLQLKATFFVTANFANHHPAIIQKIAKSHEIASHGFYHSTFGLDDLKTSKVALEAITHQPVLGFRMPRLQAVDDAAIEQAGYTYNSSMNPTYLPGRYNHFFKPRTVYQTQNLLNIPVSVTPFIRFPLFWLTFKNFPLGLVKLASQWTLNSDSYLNLYFHPWEFADLTSYQLPSYVKRHAGHSLLNRLEQYLLWLNTQGKFISFSEFQNQFKFKSSQYSAKKLTI